MENKKYAHQKNKGKKKERKKKKNNSFHISKTTSYIKLFIEYFAKHQLIIGLLSIIGLLGVILSFIGFNIDRNEATSTTKQIEIVQTSINSIESKLEKSRRDWQVMEKAFHGIRIGGSVLPVYELNFNRILRTGRGAVKTIKWELGNKNRFKVVYNSTQDLILHIETEWGGGKEGKDVGISDFEYGKTTLQDIRDTFKSNGFSYAMKVMYEQEDGIVTLNAFELKNTPSIITVFKTFIPYSIKDEIDKLSEEKQVLGKIGKYFKLIGISVSDEDYLDTEWGRNKIYDPESSPISLE